MNKQPEKPTADDSRVLAMEEYVKRCEQARASGDMEPQSAAEYLEMAGEARSKKASLGYAQKALELEPDNLDAARFVAELTAKDEIELLRMLPPLIEKGNAQMEREGHFKQDKGIFWLVFDTRPYMRLRYAYMHALLSCGMLRRAAEEGEALLELCRNDNLGVRYDLIHLYAALEDEERALALVKSNESYEENSQMLLALAALYFKLGDFDRSLSSLKKLAEINKDTKEFIAAVDKQDDDKIYDAIGPMGYRPNTIEELASALMEYEFLYTAIPSFFHWAHRELRTRRKEGE